RAPRRQDVPGGRQLCRAGIPAVLGRGSSSDDAHRHGPAPAADRFLEPIPSVAELRAGARAAEAGTVDAVKVGNQLQSPAQADLTVETQAHAAVVRPGLYVPRVRVIVRG